MFVHSGVGAAIDKKNRKWINGNKKKDNSSSSKGARIHNDHGHNHSREDCGGDVGHVEEEGGARHPRR